MKDDPRLLAAAAAAPSKIEDDRTCVACGYNLRGLTAQDRCPECGRQIAQPTMGDDPLSMMPESMINWFRVATVLAVIAMIGAFVCQWIYLGRGGSSPAIASVVLVATAFWVGGVWLLTPSFQHETAMAHGFGPRSALRPWARLLQLGWVAGASLQLLASTLTTPPSVLTWLAICGALVGIAGVIVLCLVLEQLAQWARDDRAGSAFNLAIWALVFAPLGSLALPSIGIPFSGLGPVSVLGLLLSLLPVLLWIAGILLFVYAMVSLSQAVDYSIRHARELQAREVRRARRAERFTHEAGARARETTGYGG